MPRPARLMASAAVSAIQCLSGPNRWGTDGHMEYERCSAHVDPNDHRRLTHASSSCWADCHRARAAVLFRSPFGSTYADPVVQPEGSKRGPIPWLRNRVAKEALRAAEKTDSEPEQALQLARTTLSWSLRHSGPDSAMTLNAKREVAELLERLGRFDEALQLRIDVATCLQLQLGGDDPSTLTAEGFLGFSFDRLGRHAEAVSQFERVLAGRTNILGRDDKSTLLAMEWLGCAHRSLGNLEESRGLLQEAVDRYQSEGAGETEDCMKATSHLATTLFQLEEVPEACELRRHIFEVRNRTLGPDDPTTLDSRQSLARILQWVGELGESNGVHLPGTDSADSSG